MKTLSQIREASGGKEAYQKYFTSLLTKFGVDSPSELKGDKKNKFFSALDKGWEGSGEKNEVTIHLSNELTEKLKAGKGKAKLDIDLDASDYKGGEKAFVKFMSTKYKIKIKLTRMGADISGDKQKLIAFLQSNEYGMDDADIEDLFPELMEAFSFFKKKKKGAKVNVKPGRGNAKMDIDKDAMDNVKKGADKKHGITMRPRGDEVILSGPKDKLLSFVTQELGWDKDDVESMWPDLLENSDDFKDDSDVDDDEGNYSGVDEASRFSRDLRGHAKQIFLKTLEKIKKEKIRGDKDQAAAVDDIEGAHLLNGHDKRTIIKALQYESHDDFKDDSDVDDDEGNYSGVDEKAPPGMEALVKKLKASGNSDEEAFAIAWGAYNDKERKKGRHGLKSMEGVEEGTWHLPSDKGVAAKFKKAMSKPITLGKNGEDAIDSIEKFIGDDSLFDDLNDAGKKNPKGDARKIIIKHMKTLNINPKTFHWAGQESVEGLGEAKISSTLLKKASVIAKKNSGNMQKAIKLIDKLKRGLSDTPEVMDILKKANEDVNEGVSVDRRTLGFKDAMLRNEKAKKVRETAKMKREKKKEQDELDARYEYDAGVDDVMARASEAMGYEQREDAAANANAHSGVDMAPDAGKKKKDKFKVIKRPNY